MSAKALLGRITTDGAIANGRPNLRGRDLTVETVLGYLASGETYETLSAQYSWLEPEDIRACLLYAQQLVRQVQPELSGVQLRQVIPQVLEQAPYVTLLILFGSRARGEGDRNSDWDFAFLCDEEQREQFEREGFSWLRVPMVIQDVCKLSDDAIDVVDLKDCSTLLAHFVAKDGVSLYERELGLFRTFQEDHLLSPETLKAMRQQSRENLMQTLQRFKHEGVRS